MTKIKQYFDTNLYLKLLSGFIVFLFLIILRFDNFVTTIQSKKKILYFNNRKYDLENYPYEKLYYRYYYFNEQPYEKKLVLNTGDLFILTNGRQAYLKRYKLLKNLDHKLHMTKFSSLDVNSHMCSIINLNVVELGDKLDNTDNIYIYDIYAGYFNIYKLKIFLQSHNFRDIILLKLQKNDRQTEIKFVKEIYEQINRYSILTAVYFLGIVRIFINSNNGKQDGKLYNYVFKKVDNNEKLTSKHVTCVNSIAEIYHNVGIFNIKTTEYKAWSAIDFVYNELPFTNNNGFNYYNFSINKFINT